MRDTYIPVDHMSAVARYVWGFGGFFNGWEGILTDAIIMVFNLWKTAKQV